MAFHLGIILLDFLQLFLFLKEQQEHFHELIDIQIQIFVRFFCKRRQIFFRFLEDPQASLFLKFQQFRGSFESLVFQNSLHKLCPRIFLKGALALRFHSRQKHLGFDFDQRSRKDHKLRCQIYIKLLHPFNIGYVLICNIRNMNIINAHPRIFNEIDEQIEGSFKDIQFDLI